LHIVHGDVAREGHVLVNIRKFTGLPLRSLKAVFGGSTSSVAGCPGSSIVLASGRVTPPPLFRPKETGVRGGNMAEPASEAVVLRDEEGNYYVLARETVEAGRVAEADRPQLENLIEGETSGFAVDSFIWFDKPGPGPGPEQLSVVGSVKVGASGQPGVTPEQLTGFRVSPR
jgi:hypothetical protein